MLPDSDPRSAEQKLFALMLSDEKPSREKMLELFAVPPHAENWEQEFESARNEGLSGLQQLIDLGFTQENLVDMILGALKLSKEGDDAHFYRISATGPMATNMPTMFVSRDGAAYKIIAVTDSMEEIGQRVLALLKADDLAGAQWWLDHSLPSMKTGPEGLEPAARNLWRASDSRVPDKARLAAASLLTQDETSAAAGIAILKEAYAKTRSAMDKSFIDQALCEAHEKSKQWGELAAAAKRLMASTVFNGVGFKLLMKALEEQKDWKGLEGAALLQTKDKTLQNDAWKYVAISRIAVRDGKGAADALEHIRASGASEAVELAAWNAIRQKKVSQEMVDSAKKTDGAERIDDSYLLALLEVQLSKTEDAQETLKQAVHNTNANNLDARAWVVYGDICDQYGFPESAKAAWTHARSAKGATRDARWTLDTLDSPAR